MSAYHVTPNRQERVWKSSSRLTIVVVSCDRTFFPPLDKGRSLGNSGPCLLLDDLHRIGIGCILTAPIRYCEGNIQ